MGINLYYLTQLPQQIFLHVQIKASRGGGEIFLACDMKNENKKLVAVACACI
jgi:hypothetical protein